VPGKKASEMLKVHQRTLHNWDRDGKIETIRAPGGRRLYNVKKYLEEYENDIDIDSEEEIDDNQFFNWFSCLNK
jgi:predicted site-specific integrase-resolvase